uniref:lysozyme n=1 Tax=Timema californicum TaxID=61474 RepID=A0A7R9JF47_TIMCA|nr:unnamed protein product [Timema californicum]
MPTTTVPLVMFLRPDASAKMVTFPVWFFWNNSEAMLFSLRSWVLTNVLLAFLVFICSAVFISNLSPACVRCLCEAATECNNTFACVKGYCGPFYISKIYWIDAGRPVLDEDDPERTRAYEDCATDITCAARILEAYMVKYGRDCNGDSVTNCDDYARIHYHGGTKCESPLDENTFSRRYSRCRPAFQCDAQRLHSASNVSLLVSCISASTFALYL